MGELKCLCNCWKIQAILHNYNSYALYARPVFMISPNWFKITNRGQNRISKKVSFGCVKIYRKCVKYIIGNRMKESCTYGLAVGIVQQWTCLPYVHFLVSLNMLR